MDRLIQINVNGYTITKDHNCAGSQHESGATSLRITFSEDWKHYAKTVTFWNAKGTDSVKRILTTDLLENLAQDTNTYIAPIPGEAMTDAGWFSFVIDGYIDSSRQRTVEDKLKVLPSRKADDAGDPIDPTPTQAEQLQKQIDGIIEDIQIAEQAVEAAKEAIESAKAAEASENAAAGSAAAANASAQDAHAAALNAASSATQAESHKAAVETFATTAGNASSQAQAAAQSAAASATAAAKSATSAEGSASTAVASANNAGGFASAAATSATNAARSESAAETAETNAKAAQAAAEKARDEAQGIVGGDFATREEAQGYANAAESNANAYTDEQIAAIPSPDVSGQINTHNTSSSAHTDIRQAASTAQQTANGKVSKSGDTMTGALQLQATGSAGYAKVYKNASADDDYGLQMQDVDPDGNFMGLTLSGKLQKLEFKKKKAGDTDYTYTKLYDTDNPPTAEEVGALDESGGTVYGNVNIQTDYGRLTVGSSDTHKTELVKNGDSTDDYGTILRDTNGEAVAEIKLSAANGNAKLAKDGKEYVLYHEGNASMPSAEKLAALATRTEIFTEDGAFRVPEGVTSVHVLLMGGGGGGGYGHNGGGGGGGGYFVEQDVAVTPIRDIFITIGEGGTGYKKDSDMSGATSGGATSFGDLLSADGGAGGTTYEGGAGSSGGGGGSGGWFSAGASNGNGGNGATFGGGGGGGGEKEGYKSGTAGTGGSMGGNGGAYAKGSDGIDTSALDVPYPGTATGGAVGLTATDEDTAYGGGGGGGGYGGNGGAGGNAYSSESSVYSGGAGGGGGYGSTGGQGGNAGSGRRKGGGGGGGGYGSRGTGGAGGTGTDAGSDGGIAAGGGGGGGYDTGSTSTQSGGNGGNGGKGICVVTYTLPV